MENILTAEGDVTPYNLDDHLHSLFLLWQRVEKTRRHKDTCPQCPC